MSNTLKLPKGARLLKREITKTIGGWVQMTYDAETHFLGIRWLRVKGGFSESGSESWVADTPDGCISVSDYHWYGPRFGFERYRSFHAALLGQLVRARNHAKQKARELLQKHKTAKQTIAVLEAAIQKSRGKKK